jgi:formylglycine-generating enzyme required for sulfatase activity
MLDTDKVRGAEARSGMVRVPGGTFRMGSDGHYQTVRFRPFPALSVRKGHLAGRI